MSNESNESNESEQLLNTSASFGSDINSIDLDNTRFLVKRIKYNRNNARMNYGLYIGALAFDVIWEDDTETREPIQNLICKETKSVNEHLINIINDYKNTARQFPSNSRCCLMCNNYVHHGQIICGYHFNDYSFLSY